MEKGYLVIKVILETEKTPKEIEEFLYPICEGAISGCKNTSFTLTVGVEEKFSVVEVSFESDTISTINHNIVFFTGIIKIATNLVYSSVEIYNDEYVELVLGE